MWYRGFIKKCINEKETQNYLQSVSNIARPYLEMINENPQDKELYLTALFKNGFPYNPILETLYPGAHNIYQSIHSKYQEIPYHRRSSLPRFDPNSVQWKQNILHDITYGYPIGDEENAIHSDLVNDLTQTKMPKNEYEDIHARSEGARILETIPHRILYHATTNLPAILKSGKILSREDLSNVKSGLGGGSSDSISLTTSREYAHTIASSLIFMSKVARGEITPQEMFDMAQNGEGAQKSYSSSFLDNNGDWKVDFKPLMTGKIHAGILDKHEGPEWIQIEPYQWERSLTDEEQMRESVKMGKFFLMARGEAGGTENPFFAFVNDKTLASIDPAKVGVLTLRVIDNARGYFLPAELEWRVFHGGILEIINSEPVDANLSLNSKQFTSLFNDMRSKYLKGWK